MAEHAVEERLQELKKDGFFYRGSRKRYLGRIELPKDKNWENVVDACGYYQSLNGTYVVFVTDSERGLVSHKIKCGSEEEAVTKMLEFVDREKYINLCRETLDHYEEKLPMILSYLEQEYGYGEEKAREAVEYLKQSEYTAFEFAHYVERGEFVPDRYAEYRSGYTAERIYRETGQTVLGAFNYMVYLKRKPEEALEYLKKGLPRRRMMDDREIKEAKTMEELKPSGETAVSGDPVQEKLAEMQEAIGRLQECFDEKIAQDAHKNGLFDDMHRELVRYQNGVVDKIVETLALDIIQLVDSTKGHVRVYEKKEATEDNYKRLLRIVKGIAEDLEDILYRQSIESYRVPGHEVDVRKQKIIQVVETEEQSKDNLIAARMADGYEKDGKVIRPERIKIFKYHSGESAEK